MKRVSVITPTYRRAGNLPGLVAALEAQTLGRDAFDVIVADDASPDDTARVLEELRSRTPLDLKVVRNRTNRGPGAARNLALRQTDAPVIAFTDDDCLPTPGWLEAGLKCVEAGADIVQGQTIPDPAVPYGRWAVSQSITAFDDRYETCNIFYRTATLRDAGGFDEDMPFFGEDTVLAWTALRLGATTDFEPEALVHHAVIQPGAGYYWRWSQQHGNWATLLRRFPEMRSKVLWAGLFTKRRHAGIVAAAAGIAAGVAWRPALALALPYLVYRLPRSLSRRAVEDQVLNAAFDAAVVIGLVRGSVRERTLVL